MTEKERVGQLLMVDCPTTGVAGATVTAISNYHVGSVILDGTTYHGLAATKAVTSRLQGLAPAATKLLISTDQEGGQVQRITSGVSPRPSELSLADLGTRALTCSYWTLGRQLRTLGLNQDFAPDADVVRTSGGVIGDRSFGADPRLDGRDVLAATRGLQRAGVLATLKHWPGHGSTSTDSHLALAVVHEDAATWNAVDRVPFADAARVAGAVMVGHLAVPALDPSGLPATFSPVLTRKLLVDDLGFTGLVVTDSLWMEPARTIAPPGPMAVRALQAGNDLLLEPPDLPASYAAVLHAVRTRPALRALVRAAVTKVLAAKARATAAPKGAPPGCS
jgi:beta-N-acetylhexosaminidase